MRMMIQRPDMPSALLGTGEIERHAGLDGEGNAMLSRAVATLGLSARSCHRAIEAAPSIVGIAARETITGAHVAEALRYRQGR